MYIKFQGTRRFCDLRSMLPNMTALTKIQDKIGQRNLTGAQRLRELYKMQSMHLTFRSSVLNGKDWTKKIITTLVKITHSQRVYHNFLLHDEQKGYLRRNDTKKMMVKIEALLDTRPDKIPKDSHFFPGI